MHDCQNGNAPLHKWDAERYEALPLPHVEWGKRVVGWLELTGDERVVEAGAGTGRDAHNRLLDMAMLELRPTCENCNAALPPHSTEAMICSFECTFCRACVENILANVCPNCGGGFCPRPIRPKRDWKNGDYLGAYPASTVVRHRPVHPVLHKKFAQSIQTIPPEMR